MHTERQRDREAERQIDEVTDSTLNKQIQTNSGENKAQTVNGKAETMSKSGSSSRSKRQTEW
jgi:hypothetical protein